MTTLTLAQGIKTKRTADFAPGFLGTPKCDEWFQCEEKSANLARYIKQGFMEEPEAMFHPCNHTVYVPVDAKHPKGTKNVPVDVELDFDEKLNGYHACCPECDRYEFGRTVQEAAELWNKSIKKCCHGKS